jgi:hypothetical protein
MLFPKDKCKSVNGTMKRMRTGMLLLAVVALTAGAGGPPLATHRFVLSPESRIWIDGSSTVNAFTCEAAEVEGFLTHASPDVQAAPQPVSIHEARGMLTVPVRTFDCGQRRMERDLYEALKADAFPEIRYELLDADVLTAPETERGTYVLRVTGRLTVAGTTRTVETTVRGERRPDGRLRATASQPLMMTDFGIDPPTALLGLVRARDHLVVRVDLVATDQGRFFDN